MKFVAKPDTWFDAYTTVSILDEHCTVFSAPDRKVPTLQVLCKGWKNGMLDEELCTIDEFFIVGDDYTKEDRPNVE